jgi:hypothetical protein
MAYPHNEEMVWVGGRRWWFPSSRTDAESEFEWRDKSVFLLVTDGTPWRALCSRAKVVPD